MSAPDMMPVSRCISMSIPTSRTTSGSRWNGIGARSSCRPPWFESTMPSTPERRVVLASSSFCTPLTTSLPGHWSLIQARSSKRDRRVEHRVEQLGDGAASGQRRERERRCVRKSNHHHGRGSASMIVPRGQLRRDREAVALVAQAGAGDRRVHGEEEGVEAGGRRAPRRASTTLAVATRTAGTSCDPSGSRPSRPRSRWCRASRA